MINVIFVAVMMFTDAQGTHMAMRGFTEQTSCSTFIQPYQEQAEKQGVADSVFLECIPVKVEVGQTASIQ